MLLDPFSRIMDNCKPYQAFCGLIACFYIIIYSAPANIFASYAI